VSRSDSYLATDDSDLRGRSVLAVRWSIGGQAASIALTLLSVSALSRLLSPDDFGLVAMAMTVQGFLMLFAEGGFSFAVVQQKHVDQHQASNLFWANAGLGLLVTGVACALAWPTALLFRDSRLTLVSIAMSPGIFLAALGVQHGAMLRRGLHFRRTVVPIVGSQTIALGLAMVFAIRGFGYWSLVVQQVALVGSKTMLSWAACGWRPSRPRRGSGTRRLLSLGSAWTASEALGYFRRSLPQFFVGWLCGPSELGVFTRATALMLQPFQRAIGPISSVAIPALSRVQDQPERFGKAMRDGTMLVGFIAVPACAVIAVFADQIVLLILGRDWEACVPVLRATIPGAFGVTAMMPPMSWAFNALGKSRAQARWALGSLIVAAVLVSLGSPFGMLGISLASSIAAIIAYWSGLHVALRGTGLSCWLVFRELSISLLASAGGSIAALWASKVTLDPLGMGPSFAVSMVAFAATYLAGWLLAPAGRRRLRSIQDTLMRGRRQTRP
jgi:O-antigen/teichoic acid export membrane protein